MKIKNNNERNEFDVHRKQDLTNIQIKLNSCIFPTQLPAYSKDFLQELPKSILKSI